VGGGIAFSTLLTLFVVPSAYVIMHGAAARVRGFLLTPRRSEEAHAGD
jgi:Cu/Ag efflux pump CusA